MLVQLFLKNNIESSKNRADRKPGCLLSPKMEVPNLRRNSSISRCNLGKKPEFCEIEPDAEYVKLYNHFRDEGLHLEKMRQRLVDKIYGNEALSDKEQLLLKALNQKLCMLKEKLKSIERQGRNYKQVEEKQMEKSKSASDAENSLESDNKLHH